MSANASNTSDVPEHMKSGWYSDEEESREGKKSRKPKEEKPDTRFGNIIRRFSVSSRDSQSSSSTNGKP
ncbi:hypothetical protein SMACR_06159 [Sordaria macrospora]|uniref:WGS project CABT00000000 data, contig 2.33 n=2 Tax=Sordaria macrospora TaxID=5147 RepID=F7W678_SORMK|nr:uncharacterized protein SMAC_06159 [Sordaria macrospora k-hell]KAA8633394.1 hypothetical protein SMACR_06159 [Sordaria macrospora]WPJ66981.1 hypothetical protein SMAC4_06159 [Sordaria macrospora]CCC13016.1 unnamed protein product [Sordaria macrospora k-hell]